MWRPPLRQLSPTRITLARCPAARTLKITRPGGAQSAAPLFNAGQRAHPQYYISPNAALAAAHRGALTPAAAATGRACWPSSRAAPMPAPRRRENRTSP
eukprot:7550253-Pyramimonas_sp.AAC.1